MNDKSFLILALVVFLSLAFTFVASGAELTIDGSRVAALANDAIASTSYLKSEGMANVSTNALKLEGERQGLFKEKTFYENSEITDSKLRAEGGSLSRYSLKFNFNYAGPTVGDLSSKDQPNPDGSVGSFQTALGGNMGFRYRLDSKSSLGMASGLKAIHPFHGMKRIDFSNPIVTYDRSMRVGDVQMRNSPGVILRTVPEFRRVGQYAYLLDNHSIVYDLGLSGFSLGSDFAAAYFLYNRPYQAKDGKSPRFSLDVSPNLKYRFNDKFNLLLVTNMSWWNPRSREDKGAMLNRTVSQRLGLGYSFHRDVYVNPYLSFYSEKLSPDNTTLNFSTVFSLF